MTEYTQTTDEIVAAYVESRRSTSQVPERQGREEFDRWLAAHDQGIRDACRPPELTAREHLEAAWEAAYPVPKWCGVPMGVPLITRWKNGEIWVHTTGWSSVIHHHMEVRTLEPLPPLIPDDCMVVRASCEDTPSLGRTIWQRSNDAKKWFALDPADGAWYEEPLSDLIDPKPVPEEES